MSKPTEIFDKLEFVEYVEYEFIDKLKIKLQNCSAYVLVYKYWIIFIVQ